MEKWEYMVIRSYSGVVTMVNGQEVAQMVGSQPAGTLLHEYLSGVGEDGWEVVSMAGVREGADIILKRAWVDYNVEDEEPAE
ncbi:MAG: hypothetical protein KAT29_04460 [Anaerolineales bacterium]|jgi:hypothetical protein|nr:hypothetical protein [Anaerolineales bacterium]